MTRIAIVVCSCGRPESLEASLQALKKQTRPADRILFVVTRSEDLPSPIVLSGVEVLTAPKGLPHQRNAGLAMVRDDCDILVFFDDDFVPSRHAIAGIEEVFATFADVGGMTGELIADGARGPGVLAADAARMVQDYDDTVQAGFAAPGWCVTATDIVGLYGCNMAYRMSAIRDLKFDEALPLYAWQEDIDFSARASGRKIRTDALTGVHCGVKSGRETAGRRLGYSQIANPLYLWRKGTLPRRFATRLMLRNMAANHIRAFRPEPWIDRLGRAQGNWIAIADALTGRLDPNRIMHL